MRIVLLEDEYSWADNLIEELRRHFPGANIERIPTELAFLERLDQLVATPPDVFLLDVVVKYQEISIDPQPPKPGYEQRFRAGIRCLRALRDAGVERPIIVFTVLSLERDPELVHAGCIYLKKTASFVSLFERINELTRVRRL